MNSPRLKIGMALLLLAVTACSGGVSPGGSAPAGTLNGGSGQGGDAVSGTGSSSFAGGPLDASRTAAQPLGGGFPAPSLEGDPSRDVFFYNSLLHEIECLDTPSGRFLFHMEAYVVPPDAKESLSGRVLRWFDPERKEFMDIVLQDKGGITQDEGGIVSDGGPLFLNYTGYFDVRALTANPHAFKSYLLPPNSIAVSEGKFQPCAVEPCFPATAEEVEGGFAEYSRWAAVHSVEQAVVPRYSACSQTEIQLHAPVRLMPLQRP